MYKRQKLKVYNDV